MTFTFYRIRRYFMYGELMSRLKCMCDENRIDSKKSWSTQILSVKKVVISSMISRETHLHVITPQRGKNELRKI